MLKKQKIAVVQRLCPHYRQPLFRSLSKEPNIELTLLTADPSRHEGIQSADFPWINFHGLPLDFGWKEKTYKIPLSFSLLRHVYQEAYDLVIAEGVTNIVTDIFLFPICKSRGIRFIWWDAGRRKNARKNIFRRVADPAINFLVNKADACIAYGSFAKEYMVGVGASPEKVFVANNTIDTQEIIDSLEETYAEVPELKKKLGLTGQIVLYVGVVERRKKLENLITAFQQLQMVDPITLVIVGDGPHLSEVRAWTTSSGLNTNVRFLGRIIDGIGKYFAIADVFVLPSEGGLALNQAMAYGKPVIATSADGTEIDLITNGWNGFIAEEDNIPELAEKIALILRDQDMRLNMGLNSSSRITDKYTLTHMVTSFRNAIEYALKP